MIITLLLLFGLVYIAMILLYTWGAAEAHYPTDRTYRPRVTIIVAARNEKERIGRCVDSLLALTYPRELLEIIIVDDRSTDGTAEIVGGYARANAHVRLVSIGLETELPPGKANAVMTAADVASGEILMFTDADCVVPAGWVEETVKYYADSAIGVVAGFTFLRGKRPFEEMQALDWFVLFSVAAATTRMGFPVTAVGTNLSVRRTAYDSVGGYRKIPFSVTEDYALFHAVTAGGKWKARFPMDPGGLVESAPCPSLRQLFGQKKRWFTGGRGMDAKSLAIFAFPYFFNFLIILGLFVAPWWAVVSAIVCKLIVDFILCLPATLTFRRTALLAVFPLFDLYYYIYVLLFPPIVLFSTKITWKERKF